MKTIPLKRNQYFWHFSILTIPMTVIIISVYFIVKAKMGNPIGIRSASDYYNIVLVSGIAMIILGYWQFRKLKFKTINISISKNSFENAVRITSAELNWYNIEFKDNCFIAHGKSSFFSWGQRITGVWKEDCILINSICDPDKFQAVTAWGINEENVRAFTKNITACA